MSGAAIGVENRCLMKNKNKNNNTCEHVNVDINYIIKDIYGNKNCKKRCIQFIEDDTIYSDDIDFRRMKNKKIKVENMWHKRHDSNDINNNDDDNDDDNNDVNNNDNNNDNNSDNNSDNNNDNNNDNNDNHVNTFKIYNNYNEKYEQYDNIDKDIYHTCSIQSQERSCIDDYNNNKKKKYSNNINNNNNNNKNYFMNYRINNENIKNCNNIDNNDDTNNIDSKYDTNNIDSNDDTNNIDSNNNKYNHENHNFYHKKRNKQDICLNQTEDKYLLSKKTESLVDTILFNIHSCSEMKQAKKIMLPLLNDFIQNNFYKYINFYEDNENSTKKNNVVETLQKEKKVLISAVKMQYQKILQLQKLIENQKTDIKKKTEELNQIKAKVHQYFYDINNPNNRVFSILSPDVY
ncbi:conserved Plasmodium protein, unknown function [Plasmodium sp. gorilla clade G2]|uniref:conserved Plasmodium protein, unknown function n=1 Tax=Plasmodium sp. gorilla clade G2 TaxID=880535 RepID=UPI000D22527B|nr:conserved Plasmodium protein, unknown function [Plasmodium sp. gorilla clade G2]SOV18805.1 conserved Plasmodium protein, unknown function [Plasmodium sp. gorilla clade G2]